MNWSVAELWGKNLDTDAHAQLCKFVVRCCSIGLTHPAACTWARMPLTFGHVWTQTPWLLDMFGHRPLDFWTCLDTDPLTFGHVEVWTQTPWAEDSDDVFTTSWKLPRLKLEPPPQTKSHRRNPLWFDPYIYQSIALDAGSQICNFYQKECLLPLLGGRRVLFWFYLMSIFLFCEYTRTAQSIS